MEDELGGTIMTEIVALRPKLYSYKKLDGSEDKRCQVGQSQDNSTEYRSQLMFRSSKHEVHTIEVSKVALNRDDDKRIFKRDGISTFARGHKDLSWNPLLGEVLLI